MKVLVRLFRCLLFVALLWPQEVMCAEASGDSVRASLLTCSPGTLVYQLYGHTALRVENYTRGYDVVFNYGVFSFDKPHFAFHFVLGECDYTCECFPYALFMEDYERRGSEVTEQELNLTREEANRLAMNLAWNVLPQNKTYRYNFLLCNCTTRVRDIVEQSVDGHIAYQSAGREETFRTILHEYTRGYDWYEQGNDILLGASVDTVVTDRAAMFAPERMMAYADGATIVGDDGACRPLVRRKTVLLRGEPLHYEQPFPLTPRQTGWAIAALLLLVLLVEQASGRMMWGLDAVLMAVQGLAGLLLAFMFCFSSHPGVGSNWQLWVINPLPLLCMPWVVWCAARHKRCAFHALNLCGLVLFMLFYKFIPQDCSAIIVPLTLGLALRPVSYLIYYRRNPS